MKLGQFFVRLPILGVQESIFIRAMADEAKRSRGGGANTAGNRAGRGQFSAVAHNQQFHL